MIYLQSARHDFVNFDDEIYVYENRHVLDGLTRDSFTWAFANVEVSNWHPLTWLSLMADAELVGHGHGAPPVPASRRGCTWSMPRCTP